jgi:hypothetical protein
VHPHLRDADAGTPTGLARDILVGHGVAALRAQRRRLRIIHGYEGTPGARPGQCPGVTAGGAVERTLDGPDRPLCRAFRTRGLGSGIDAAAWIEPVP